MQSDPGKQSDNLEPANNNDAPQRGAAAYGILAAKGFAMGSADVVPGVSGGTMAFILGIYEELIFSIRMVAQPEFWHALVGFRIREAMRLLHLPFLIAVFAGIFAAILTLAPGIEWTLENQPVYLWSFFFGLIIASVIVVSRRVKRLACQNDHGPDPGRCRRLLDRGLGPHADAHDLVVPHPLSGALASIAMILPGISGSFILVLLGKYDYVINAVNERDLVSIALIGIGAVIGLVAFSQVLGWLFKRYHDVTVAVLDRLHGRQFAQDLAVERGPDLDDGSPRRRGPAGGQECVAGADGRWRLQHGGCHCPWGGAGRLSAGDPH